MPEYFKSSKQQHIGSLELNRYRQLLTTKYETLLKYSVASYGILKNLVSDPSFNNLKIELGTKTWKYTLKAGYALDKNFNLIYVPNDIVDVFDLVEATNGQVTGTPYILIEHQPSIKLHEEVGTVNLSAAGVLTGTGTKFKECLRGQPYIPTKIRFTNTVYNFQEFEILSVTSDTVAAIKLPGSITPELGLTYKVVGAFTPGVAVPNSAKDIYTFEENNFKLSIWNPGINFDPTLVPKPGLQFGLAFAGPGVVPDQRDANLLALI